METAEKPDRTVLWSAVVGFAILVAITWIRFTFSTALTHALVLLVLAGSFKVLIELASTLVIAARSGSLRKVLAEADTQKVVFLSMIGIATVGVATFLIPTGLAVIVVGTSFFVATLVFFVGLANV